jgi:hypothetical protein
MRISAALQDQGRRASIPHKTKFALAKLMEVDVYPAGDYRASLAYKLVVAVVGFAVGLALLAHATIVELRRRRGG